MLSRSRLDFQQLIGMRLNPKAVSCPGRTEARLVAVQILQYLANGLLHDIDALNVIVITLTYVFHIVGYDCLCNILFTVKSK